jgi:hypothetical protein
MGIFSKTITTEKIGQFLAGFFDAGYDSLVIGLKDIFKDQGISISEEQEKEIMMVPFLAIARAIYASLGKSEAGNSIVEKFKSTLLSEYFKNYEEGNIFLELFLKRSQEYSQVLKADNEDFAIQFGQIFCDHFFEKKEGIKHAVIMYFIGASFCRFGIESKKFLDEIISKYTLIVK